MNWIRRLLSNANSTRSMILGAIASTIYYSIIHLPAFHGTVLYTYTTEHITEYAIVCLFFWVNSDLLLSFLATRTNLAASRHNWIPSRQGMEPPAQAPTLLEQVKSGPQRWLGSMKARRLISALTYVSERQSAEGFREYLNDLAERDADEIAARYAFPKFITALLPILGLLGTVVHFGSALSGLSAAELAEKIPEIVSGMGTAFNTTCAALTASISTMLIRFLVERRDEELVLKLNSYAEDELLYRFTSAESELDPWLAALNETQESTLAAIGLYEQRLAQRWMERTANLNEQVAATDRAREDQFARLLTAMEQLQQAQLSELQNIRAEYNQASRLVCDIADSLSADGHLQQLQEQLVQNLSLLRQSQQFDTAMHELTAAIHLLTARQSHVTRAA